MVEWNGMEMEWNGMEWNGSDRSPFINSTTVDRPAIGKEYINDYCRSNKCRVEIKFQVNSMGEKYEEL